jgi:hypothetical protein
MAKKKAIDEQLVHDAQKMLLCGVAVDVAVFAFAARGHSQRDALSIVRAGARRRADRLANAVMPTRIEIVEMHRILFADALSAQKLDTATKVLRSMTDLVVSEPELPAGLAFDQENPRAYLVAVLNALGQGKHIPAAVIAAVARAVNACVNEPDDDDGKDDGKEPSPPPANVAEAAQRALHLISGGKP